MSTSAHAGQPYLAPYVATKAGLAGLTRNAAHAHRWDRIRINGLNIGWTDTEGEDATQRQFHGAGDDWRAKAGARIAVSPEAVLASGVDGMVIAAPTGLHAELIELCVAAGLPTFCEKPVARDSDEAASA